MMFPSLTRCLATLLLLFAACGSVNNANPDGPPADAAPVMCDAGSRLCAGQCAANDSPVWAFDDHHCGALGGSCQPGNVCQSGTCASATAAGILNTSFTANKHTGPDLLAVAGTLYWTGPQGFSGACAPANGGCAEGGPLTNYFAGNVRLLASTGGNFLYYTYPQMDEIWVLNRTSTGSMRVAGSIGGTQGLALDASGNLFFTNAAGVVGAVAGGVGSPMTLLSGPPNAQKIIVAGTTLYYATWGSGATTGEVRAVPIGGGGSYTSLGLNQAKPTYLFLSATTLYWTNQGDGTVKSQDVNTPSATPKPIASNQALPLGITADASAVYWVNQGNGTVMKALLCSGEVLPIASGQTTLNEIVIVDGRLFWTDTGADQIVSMAE